MGNWNNWFDLEVICSGHFFHYSNTVLSFHQVFTQLRRKQEESLSLFCNMELDISSIGFLFHAVL